LKNDERKDEGKMTGTKHASAKHKRKEHRLTEKALARSGADRLAEAARKRQQAETAARKDAKGSPAPAPAAN
jgi:hypothetical protein